MSQPREQSVRCWPCGRLTWNYSGSCDLCSPVPASLTAGPVHVSPVSLVEWPGSSGARGAGAVTPLTAPAKNGGEP